MSASTLDNTSNGTSVIDLDAYFERIGYTGARSPDLATLTAIVVHHTRSIPFENLDPLLGRPPELDPSSLQAKLVHDGRGGYCFEQNSLLRHVLDGLGFTTTGLAARVLWGREEGLPLPGRSHMVVRVDLPEGPHIVDVAFGGQTPTGVLRLEPGIEQTTAHEPFRLVEHDGVLRMQSWVKDEWRSLYQFDLQPQLQVDYEVYNWHSATHPDSVFVNELVVARATIDGRYALRDGQITVHELDRGSDQRTLHSTAEVEAVLENTFGIDLSTVDRPALRHHLATRLS